MSEILFFVAGAGAIAGAVGVVALGNPFYSVLALVSHLLSLAALFLLLRAEFVAASQVIVYAGAVMVLYVFVVSYVGETAPGMQVSGLGRGMGYLFAGALAAEVMIAMLGSGLKAIGGEGAPYDASFGSPSEIGSLLLTKFLLPFEVASFLLLVAAVGAVVLARRRGGVIEDATRRALPVLSVMDVLRDQGAGSMLEGVHPGDRAARGSTPPRDRR